MKNNELRPVFLLSSGRSGSTLLQRYLNASNDLVIWGEHGGFLSGPSNGYFKFVNAENIQKLLTSGKRNADLLLRQGELVGEDIEWVNNFELDDLRSAYREMVLRMFTIGVPSSIRWGFKEIRYGDIEIKFLIELFPQSQWIFIVRNPIDTLTSMIAAWFNPTSDWGEGGWKNDLDRLNEFITRQCSRIVRISEGITKNLYNGYLVQFEDLNQDPITVLRTIYDYLDVMSPPSEKIIALSTDIRRATKKNGIREILQHSFSAHNELQRVCEIYTSFGYSCFH